MRWYKFYFPIFILIGLFLLPSKSVAQGPQWYQAYQSGKKAIELGDWNTAAQKFKLALQGKNEDKGKQRIGTMFIQYYPHRELGICYYHLGQIEQAKKELTLSIQQSSSYRAKEYLNRTNQGVHPKPETDLPEKPPAQPPKEPDVQPLTPSSSFIGEKLRIAVLPFDSRGFSGEIGDMNLMDKMIAAFLNTNRFNVVARAQLDKIIEEQKLGMTGILDEASAAEVGRGIGVDAVVVGSVTRASNSLSIDARLIDTETADIVSAKDAYSRQIDMQNISQMVSELVEKIKIDIPRVKGIIINIVGEKLTLDIGSGDAVKKGMRCIVYREGNPLIHPETQKVLGITSEVICEIQLTKIFENHSNAIILKEMLGRPSKLDKVQTK